MSDLVDKVDLSFSCTELRDLDLFSLSDPQVIIYMRDKPSSNWIEVGRTEKVKNNLNPKFVKTLKVDYYFERSQYIKLLVVDVDSNSTSVSDQTTIGEVQCSLAEIITSGSTFKRALVHPSAQIKEKRGFIEVSSEQVCKEDADITFSAAATGLARKDIFGSSDPFLVISRVNESGAFQPVHKTEVHKNTLNVTFEPIKVTAVQLCNGDYFRTLRVECFDWNRSGHHELIGSLDTSLDAILKNQGLDAPLMSKKQKEAGRLRFSNVTHFKKYSFLDYIRSGYQINTCICVDFTGSNGIPTDPRSLHYISGQPGAHNQYQMAIWSIGSIIDYYDSDHMYPCFGFGAKVPPTFQVDHCFPLSLNPQAININSIEGVLYTYDQCVRAVQLHGPTNFAQIIRRTADNVRMNMNSYHIMLIITDGEISDINNTIHEIVEASYLPLSIIIVGVGNADFTNMNRLDGDVVPLSYGGKRAARDIVQFVALRDYSVGDPSLAAAVLCEVPQQFVSYMSANKIVPRNAV